ncbi:MAG: NrdJb [Gammaproteobacteria bacterium]
MAIKISNKIVGYQVQAESDDESTPADNVIQMHEKLERPEMLLGSTYKIKTPLSDHALYITINDIVLNPDTEHELRRPFEVFINSKNMEHFQWVLALTRIISAVFRKGGDVTFLVEELRSVFDPSGGYFKKGGKFMPSLVAEIGEVIETHMKLIGLIKDEAMDETRKAFLEQKKAQLEEAKGPQPTTSELPSQPASPTTSTAEAVGSTGESYPASATLCDKCHTKAVVMMDGCQTCLSCGYSKCG